MAPFPFNVIRTVFAAGEHIAPQMTGRVAFELFCRTPSRSSMTVGERRAVESARDFMAEARHHCLTLRSGGQIAAHEFRPDRLERRGKADRETVLVIHGWRSRTEYMRSIITGYREQGYRVVSIDLPGHGQSAGRRLNMALGVEAARAAADWFGPFAAVVGHSFGGAVAVNAAFGSIAGVAAVDTKALVTIASPASLPALFRQFGKAVRLGPQAQSAIAGRVEEIAGRSLSDFEGREMLAQLRIPTLVIHDEGDAEVAVQEAHDMARAGNHVSLKLTNGLGHRRILADRGVSDESVGFVAGHAERRLGAVLLH